MNINQLTLQPSKNCPAFFAVETFSLSKTTLYSGTGFAVFDSKTEKQNKIN